MKDDPNQPVKIVTMRGGEEWAIYTGGDFSNYKHRRSGPKVKDYYDEAVAAGVRLMEDDPSLNSTETARRCAHLTTNKHADDSSVIRELAKRIRNALKQTSLNK